MNRIKILREEYGYTQQELADKLNGAKSTIAMYENETRKPSLEILVKLSEIFNCSIDYILYKTDIRKYDKDFEEFHFAYHKEMEGLTDEEIADALRFYKEMKKRVEKDNK